MIFMKKFRWQSPLVGISRDIEPFSNVTVAKTTATNRGDTVKHWDFDQCKSLTFVRLLDLAIPSVQLRLGPSGSTVDLG